MEIWINSFFKWLVDKHQMSLIKLSSVYPVHGLVKPPSAFSGSCQFNRLVTLINYIILNTFKINFATSNHPPHQFQSFCCLVYDRVRFKMTI